MDHDLFLGTQESWDQDHGPVRECLLEINMAKTQ